MRHCKHHCRARRLKLEVWGLHMVHNCTSQGTRHAEFEAIDKVLAAAGGDAAAADFARCVLHRLKLKQFTS